MCMSASSSVFSERMVALWLRMDTARERADVVAQQASRAVSDAVDAFKLAVQDGQLYSDAKLDSLTHAINQAVLAAIPQALDEAERLMQVAREARTFAMQVDDGKTAEKNVANELAARAECLVERLRSFIHKYASCARGLRADDKTLKRLATLWKGDLPTTLTQTFDGVRLQGRAA